MARGDDLLWIVVPARLSSRRFPNKALAGVAGEPMVRQVVRRVLEATEGMALPARVLVATDAAPIARVVEDLCEVVLAPEDPAAPLRTGTDRVHDACARLRAAPPRWIVNVQGDEPCLPPAVLRAIVARRLESEADIVSACVPMSARDARFGDPDVVKVVLGQAERALLFSRAPIPHGVEQHSHWHWHVGVYAFTGASLARFAALESGQLERLERLEQLRALEAGMRIEMAVLHAWTDAMWPSVDRPADAAEAARYLLERPAAPPGEDASPSLAARPRVAPVAALSCSPDPSTV